MFYTVGRFKSLVFIKDTDDDSIEIVESSSLERVEMQFEILRSSKISLYKLCTLYGIPRLKYCSTLKVCRFRDYFGTLRASFITIVKPEYLNNKSVQERCREIYSEFNYGDDLLVFMSSTRGDAWQDLGVLPSPDSVMGRPVALHPCVLVPPVIIPYVLKLKKDRNFEDLKAGILDTLYNDVSQTANSWDNPTISPFWVDIVDPQ